MSFSDLLLLHSPKGASINSVQIEITKGGQFNSSDPLEGRVIGLINPSADIAQPDYAEPNCFAGSGIWTTAVQTFVSQTVSGTTTYWVPGYLDTTGILWTIDVGIICMSTGEISIKERHLSLSGTFTFKSKLPFHPGIKVAILRQVTSNSVTDVAYAYGNYQNKDFLTRTSNSILPQFRAADQESQLEDLALGLIALINSNYTQQKDGLTLFRLKGEPDPLLSEMIKDNFDRLSRLSDLTSSTNRAGSIPNLLASYLEPEMLYGSSADQLYNNPEVEIVEEGYCDPTCYALGNTPLLTSREVRTRSIAWLAFSAADYFLRFNDAAYSPLLESLSYYLINQIHSETHLIREGWTDSLTLTGSVSISGFRLSTAVATFLALSKLYEVTENALFLDYASLIKEAILSELFDLDQGQFVHSKDQRTYSAESFIYGLIFALSIKRADLIEQSLESLNTIDIANYGQSSANYLLSNGSLISDGQGGYQYASAPYLSPAKVQANPLSLLLIQPSALDSTNLNSVIRLNLLLMECLDQASKNNYVVASPIQTYKSVFLDWIKANPSFSSMSFFAYDLKQSLFGTLLSSSVVQQIDTLSFENTRIYQKLIKLLQIKGPQEKNKTDLAWGFTQILRNLSIRALKILKSFSLTTEGSLGLKRKSLEYSLPSLAQESESEFIARSQKYLKGISLKTTESEIKNYLLDLGVESEIQDQWKKIQVFNTFEESIGPVEIGRGYYTDASKISANVVELVVKQPISNILPYLQQVGAAGVKVITIQQISLQTDQPTEETYDPALISLGSLLTESGDIFVLEDSEPLIVGV